MLPAYANTVDWIVISWQENALLLWTSITNRPYFNTRVCFLFCIFIILYYDQHAQLFHKLSHSFMFRHYRVILSELIINTLSGYTNI